MSRVTSHVTRHTSFVNFTRRQRAIAEIGSRWPQCGIRIGAQKWVPRHTSHVTRHTSHFTRHTSHVTLHVATCTFLSSTRSWDLRCYPIPSHITRHTSHVTRHTSHVTLHTSHVTRHTSHVTRHTSHVTRHVAERGRRLSRGRHSSRAHAAGHLVTQCDVHARATVHIIPTNIITRQHAV